MKDEGAIAAESLIADKNSVDLGESYVPSSNSN